jgi:hypothetical protein
VDPRNDENLLVAQVQIGFMRRHNAVCKTQGWVKEDETTFEMARSVVVRAYQEVVVHDFARRILHPDVYEKFLHAYQRGEALIRALIPGERIRIPVEFAAAAFRFAHSMVQPTYAFRPSRDPIKLEKMLRFTGTRWMGGYRSLQAVAVPQWDRFLTSRSDGNFARMIGPSIARELNRLTGPQTNLAVINLLRGNGLGLPNGQDAARCCGFDPLAPEVIESVSDQCAEVVRRYGFDRKTPLWFYVLCEAAAGSSSTQAGVHLGRLGSTFVAETLLPLLRPRLRPRRLGETLPDAGDDGTSLATLPPTDIPNTSRLLDVMKLDKGEV